MATWQDYILGNIHPIVCKYSALYVTQDITVKSTC
jgi:hypothetical protein